MGPTSPVGEDGEPLIHLDTSFLIRALVKGSGEAHALRGWLRSGRLVAISALAWGEFLCGPVDPRVAALGRRIIRTHVPIGIEEATTAARLFNDTGRRRGTFQDCLIAATALEHGAILATTDHADFERFVPSGLELAG